MLFFKKAGVSLLKNLEICINFCNRTSNLKQPKYSSKLETSTRSMPLESPAMTMFSQSTRSQMDKLFCSRRYKLLLIKHFNHYNCLLLYSFSISYVMLHNIFSIQGGEKIIFDGELTVDNLKTFIFVESLPAIVEFNQETAQIIFGGQIKSHLLVFLSREAGHFEKYTPELEKPSKDYRGKVSLFTNIYYFFFVH